MYNNFKRRDTVICDRIRALREKTGMSARKFAEEMGMKYTTYYGYETGSREPGSDSILKAGGSNPSGRARRYRMR